MEDLHSLNCLNWENEMAYDKTDMILIVHYIDAPVGLNYLNWENKMAGGVRLNRYDLICTLYGSITWS